MLEGLGDEVVVAHAHPAHGDQEIAIVEGGAHAIRDLGEVVLHERKNVRHCARSFHHERNRIGDAIRDRVGATFGTGSTQFVSGGEDGHAGPTVHFKRLDVEGGREREELLDMVSCLEIISAEDRELAWHNLQRRVAGESLLPYPLGLGYLHGYYKNSWDSDFYTS